jgi:hypothetical protein
MKFYDANHRFLMRIADCRNPQEKHPLQDVNHPPPAKMKYTEEAAVPVPDSAARWRARRGHLSKLYSVQQQRRRMHERKTTRLNPRKNTPTHTHAKAVKNVKFQHQINQAAKTWNFAQYKLQQEKANDRKQLYEATHLYLMNSNYYRKIRKKTTTSKYHS